jgi:hypothetical protein
MLGVGYAERHIQALYAESNYAECRYAECRGALKRLKTLSSLVEREKFAPVRQYGPGVDLIKIFDANLLFFVR